MSIYLLKMLLNLKTPSFLFSLLFTLLLGNAHAQLAAAVSTQADYIGIFDAHILPDGHLSVLTRKVSQGVRTSTKDFSANLLVHGFGQPKIITIQTNGLYDLESLYDPKISIGNIQITCLNCAEIPSEISSNFGIVNSITLPETMQDLKLFLENRRLEKVKRITAEAKKIQDDKERALRVAEEKARISKDGDGSYEDRKCKEFGFKFKTPGYADCRLKLLVLANQALEREEEYKLQQKQLEQQSKAHEKYLAEQNRIAREQLAFQEKEAKRLANQRALDTSLRLLSGQSPIDAIISTGTGAPIGNANSSNSHLIQMPNGKMTNCITNGNLTQCY